MAFTLRWLGDPGKRRVCLSACNHVIVESTSRAVRLLTATEKWFPFVIDLEAVTVEQMALAGLARCRRLLHGMTNPV